MAQLGSTGPGGRSGRTEHATIRPALKHGELKAQAGRNRKLKQEDSQQQAYSLDETQTLSRSMSPVVVSTRQSFGHSAMPADVKMKA